MASNKDEDRRKLLKPKVSTEEVLSILNDFYVAGDASAEVIRELDSYDDANYLVKIDGEKALLKIHNGVESEKFIRLHSARNKSETNIEEGESTHTETSIIDLHTALYDHLAKPEYNVTTCKTIPVKSHSSHKEDENRSICIRELPVRPIDLSCHSFSYANTLINECFCPLSNSGCKFRAHASRLGHKASHVG